MHKVKFTSENEARQTLENLKIRGLIRGYIINKSGTVDCLNNLGNWNALRQWNINQNQFY